jgi:hypothetical protein
MKVELPVSKIVQKNQSRHDAAFERASERLPAVEKRRKVRIFGAGSPRFRLVYAPDMPSYADPGEQSLRSHLRIGEIHRIPDKNKIIILFLHP